MVCGEPTGGFADVLRIQRVLSALLELLGRIWHRTFPHVPTVYLKNHECSVPIICFVPPSATSMGVCLAVARIGAIFGNVSFGAFVDADCAVPILTVAVMLALAAVTSLKLKETRLTALT